MQATRAGRARLAARAKARVGAALLLASLLALAASASTSAPGSEQLARVPTALPGAPPLPEALRESLASELARRGASYVPRTRNRRADGSPLYTNRLLLEASPYLQQHAHNPVDWRPWGEEAFQAARELDRPVLVSIGYSTCHWCHVMEEETFDDAEIVRFLNEHFIAIKVDREARPDVDSIYMSAIQALGQQGGWPLNVWLTPDGDPFYAGTYFPAVDDRGRPGFSRVIRAIQVGYSQDRAAVATTAARLREQITRELEGTRAKESRLPDAGLIDLAVRSQLQHADRVWGGSGRQMKFPSSLPIRLLLLQHHRSADADSLAMAVLTLEKMAGGGLHDHVGGGFHRYATDRRWLIPHFEKMLYDNALLARSYLDAAQLTGRQDFRRVVRSTLDYVGREMTAPGGGFYSASDADSPNEKGELREGWYFSWTSAEIDAALPEPQAKLAKDWFGVTSEGNYEGRNVLHTWSAAEAFVAARGLSTASFERELEAVRAGLARARAQRAPPHRDDKIVVAWNGLMISAFARAGFALAEPEYVERARRAADFVLQEMRVGERLLRISLRGESAGPAFLEDYAFLIAGLLDLYEVDPDPAHVAAAVSLQRVLDLHYSDAGGGGYLRTADDGERLLVREKPAQDGAIPCGNSIAAANLQRLAALTGDERYRAALLMLFSAFHEPLLQRPASLGEMLMALDAEQRPTLDIVLVAPEQGGDAEPMLARLRASYLPDRVLSRVREGEDLAAHARIVPLVAGKRALGGRVTAYVCWDRVCAFPTSDPETFAQQLVQPPARAPAP